MEAGTTHPVEDNKCLIRPLSNDFVNNMARRVCGCNSCKDERGEDLTASSDESSSHLVESDSDEAESSTLASEVDSVADVTCRVCHEQGRAEDMLAPCPCRGSMRWVHATCWETNGGRCVIHPGVNIPEFRPPPPDPIAMLATGLGPCLAAMVAEIERTAKIAEDSQRLRLEFYGAMLKGVKHPLTVYVFLTAAVVWGVFVPLSLYAGLSKFTVGV